VLGVQFVLSRQAGSPDGVAKATQGSPHLGCFASGTPRRCGGRGAGSMAFHECPGARKTPRFPAVPITKQCHGLPVPCSTQARARLQQGLQERPPLYTNPHFLLHVLAQRLHTRLRLPIRSHCPSCWRSGASSAQHRQKSCQASLWIPHAANAGSTIGVQTTAAARLRAQAP
jgi:hypothetical protein